MMRKLSREVYMGCDISGLYKADLWVRYFLWHNIVVGYAKHTHIAQLMYHSIGKDNNFCFFPHSDW